MNVFLVGGAVRDRILGIDSKDNDWVVVGETPEAMIKNGFRQVGADFPVFIHPKSGDEYALARTERKSGKGYHGFTCDFSKEISLEDDLKRRDLTINAMAISSTGELIDPYNGKKDLQNKILRHVSNSFSEDPLRVLRVARFMSRYSHLGFTVAEETIELMKSLRTELVYLTPERVWKELSRALLEKTPSAFFETLRKCNCLESVIPEVDKLFGIPQPKEHHPEIDTGVHSMMALDASAMLSNKLEVRFAALVHDLGKTVTSKDEWPAHRLHEIKGVSLIDNMCDRLKIPNDCRILAKNSSQFHLHVHNAFKLQAKTVINLFSQVDAFRNKTKFEDFLVVCEADSKGRLGFEQRAYPQSNYLLSLFLIAKKQPVQPLLDAGYSGEKLGILLRAKRIMEVKKVVREEREKNMD
jgi:tRNA nucleotidyltransferase/poly(A) polymerase